MRNDNHAGLSPSSLSLFLSCRRKYYLKKIAKVEPDKDIEEDTEALRVGKAFHKCLEDTMHSLSGYTINDVKEVCLGHELSEEFHVPLLFTMLRKYKVIHEKAGLRALAGEIEIDTPEFYGFVDVILEDKKGKWWIADMKTAASYSPSLLPTLPRHSQLNLYALHYKEVADILGLDPKDYMGCRYRLTTKSKLVRRKGEPVEDYMKRLSGSVVAFDFILPKAVMDDTDALALLSAVRSALALSGSKSGASFPKTYDNCMKYYRPCEYWSQCHGRSFSDGIAIDYVSSEK